MVGNSRPQVGVRLAVEDAQQAIATLKSFGAEGERSLSRIRRETEPATRGFASLRRATGEVRGEFAGLAGRLGPVGAVLSSLGPAGLAAGAALGGLAGGLLAADRAARQAITHLSAIGDVADRLGVTAEQLQELQFAAEQNGVAAATLDMAWQRFTRRLGEAQNGTGELIGVLDQYNIAVKNADGSNRAAIAVYRDFAEAVQNVRDPQEQLRLAFKAFDSEGAALVRLVRQGADGLDEYARKARVAGVVVDEELVRSAVEAGDEMASLERQQRAALDRIGIIFSDWAVGWQRAKVDILQAIAEIADASQSLDRQSDVAIASTIGDLQERYDTLLGNVTKTFLDRGIAIPEGVQRRLDALESRLVEAAQEQFSRQPRPDYSSTSSPGASALPIPRPRGPEPAGGASSRQVRTIQAVTDAERERQRVMREGARITEALRTPTEEYYATLANLDRLLAEGAITAETYQRAQSEALERLSRDAEDSFDRYAESAEDAARRAERAMEHSTRQMGESLVRFLESGGRDVDALLNDLMRQANSVLSQLAGAGLQYIGSSIFNSIFGPGDTGPTGASFAAELAGGVRPLHEGGIAGVDGGPPRRISPLAWQNAQRLHNGGMAANEVPAVLLRGERVLTEAQQESTATTLAALARMAQAGGGNDLRIVIVNETEGDGAAVRAEEGRGPNGEREIRLFVRDQVVDLLSSGSLDGVFNTAFGLSRRGSG